jgi:spore germination protein YaaH
MLLHHSLAYFYEYAAFVLHRLTKSQRRNLCKLQYWTRSKIVIIKNYKTLAVLLLVLILTSPSYANATQHERADKNGLDWVHAFYAFSSYEQRELIKGLDAVTFGWSAMEWSEAEGARLNTSASNGNAWRIPDSYQLIAGYPRRYGVAANLGVFMDDGLEGMLADTKDRNEAVKAIIKEATRVYGAIGRSPFDGVTIDFEGLSGEDAKENFNKFLTSLAGKLRLRGMSLYVCVQPNDNYDGYDYRKIGELADKVILMAHDYQPSSLEGFEGTDWQLFAALTPIDKVRDALEAITDAETGITDAGKIALAYSITGVGWMIDENGCVVSPEPANPSMNTILSRMEQPDTVFGWSEEDANPYLIYNTEAGERVFLWYEDSKSVTAKMKLANEYGITGASVWRLGNVPTSPVWNVWGCFGRLILL